MALAQRVDSRATRPARKKRQSSASNVINLRADEATRRLIDSAANALGQNRTDFMLMTARVRAQEVLLSRTHFVLSDTEWAAFQEALDAPSTPTAELVALMTSTPPWGK